MTEPRAPQEPQAARAGGDVETPEPIHEPDGDRSRFELPEGLGPEEERAIVTALERYLIQEVPKPTPWVLSGRIEGTGLGALQVRRIAREPWHRTHTGFARRGVPPVHGRGDVR